MNVMKAEVIDEVAVIKPCIHEVGKVIAEVRIKGGFVAEVIEQRLKQRFSQVTYNQQFGVAQVKLEGKKVIVNKSGRIHVRSAESEQDARETIKKVYEALKGED